VLAKAIIESGLSDLCGKAPALGFAAKGPVNAAFDAPIAAGQTVTEALEAANRVFEEFEGRVPEWRAEQSRQRDEQERAIAEMGAQHNWARALAAARSNPRNASDIINDLAKLNFRLRVVGDNQLEIAPPPSGLPNDVRAYLVEYREQIVAELCRRCLQRFKTEPLYRRKIEPPWAGSILRLFLRL
jgi:hypothetical protein